MVGVPSQPQLQREFTLLDEWQLPPVTPHRWVKWWLRHPKVSVFAGLVLLMFALAVAAPLITPYDPVKTAPAQALQSPSLSHPLGTDNLGRDVFTRVLYGARISFRVAIIAVGIALSAGVSMGLIAGYVPGFVDQVLSRSMDALLAFPGILLAIAITNALGPSLANAMIAVGILGIPTYFRLTRGQVIQAREFEYVTAAKVLGASRLRIIVRHIFPNIINPLIIGASIASSGAILALAALSFLGIGSQPPTPDWGSMIYSGAGYLNNFAWLTLGPGLAIFVTVFSFYTLGDALRDALDPRLRGL
jgi:peptide/nickel transport system permease protein